MYTALRLYATAGVALIGTGLVAVAPAVSALPGQQVQAVQLTAGEDVGLIVGGSGIPIPQLKPGYIEDANELYIQRILPGAESQGVFTPEGLQPIYSGIKSLPFDVSTTQGATMLNTYITDETDAGNTVAVYGESQSSTISGFVMKSLEQEGVPADAVKFALVGDPSNPAGGLLERFAGLVLPSLQITFSGSTPADTEYDTSIFTQEYDGFADFPKYPINFLADLNAVLGLQMVHPTYRALTEQQLDDAILLPGSHDNPAELGDGATTAATATDYYLIPTFADKGLPVANLIGALPLIGKPLADLLAPDLRILVNMGYDNDDPLQGWDSTPANVGSQFGFLPSFEQWLAKLEALGPATQQGVDAFVHDLSSPAALLSATASADPLLAGLVGGAVPAAQDGSLTGIVNGITAAVAHAYSLLLPMADIGTAIFVTLPTYDVSLFVDNIFSNPLDAVGLPLAADVGLVTAAAGIGLMVLQQTVGAIEADLAGIF